MKSAVRAAWAGAVIAGALVGAPVAVAAFPGQDGPIVFERYHDYQGGAGSPALWAAAADGSGAHLLVAGAATGSPSASGTSLVYTTGAGLYLAHADGTSSRLITIAPSGTTIDSPHLSPDGARIVFSLISGPTTASIETVAVASGSSPVPVTSGAYDITPRYSPDGTKIVFSRGSGTKPGHIYTVAPDGTGITDVSQAGSSQYDSEPDFTPDGLAIVFSRRQNSPVGPTTTHIVRMAADGSGQTDLTPTETGDATSPSVSPDGKQIVYLLAAADGSQTLTVMNLDGSAGHPLGDAGDSYTYANPHGDADGTPEWGAAVSSPPAQPQPRPQPPQPPAKPTAGLLSAAFDVYDGVHLPHDVAFGTVTPHYTAGDSVIMTAQCRDLNAMLSGCTLFDFSAATGETDGYNPASGSYLFGSDRVLANQWTFAAPAVGEHAASLVGAYGDAGSVALVGHYVVDPPPQPPVVAAQLRSSAADASAQLAPALGVVAGGLPVDAGLSLGNGGSLLDLSSGAGIVSTSGSGLISQDGAGLISQDGAGLVGQDGTGLISQDGAGILSTYGGGLSDRGGAARAGAAAAGRPTYLAVVDRLGRPVALIVARGGRLWIVATTSITHAPNGALVVPRTSTVIATGTGTVTSRGIRFRTLRAVGKRRFRVRPGQVVLGMRAPVAGTLRTTVVTAGRHPVTVARGSVRVSVHGQPTTMSLTVSAAGRRLFKRAGRHVRLVLVETLTPRVGKPVRVSRVFTVSPRPRRKAPKR